jgi:hypothetical protein
MLRAIALVAALSSPVFAETSVDVGHDRPEPRRAAALAFGDISKGTHLDAVSVELRGLRATAKLTLSSTTRDPQDASLEFEVPVGTQVTYLGLAIGSERRIAHLETSAVATEQYARIVDGEVDPALIEWVASTASTDKLRLRVFPLTRGKPAKVEVIMTLPPAASIVIDPGRHRIANLPRARRLALGQETAAPSELAVDRARSLFIAEPWMNDFELESARERAVLRREQEARRNRGAIRIAQECLDNPLAPSCM